jgi:nucleoside-diphosphate-sugar epimerase
MSRDWTIEFAEKMIAGAWSISAADAEGICNLVYVDDVVLAVLCALRAPEPRSEVFNVSGPEAITWADYFRRLNAALGCSDLAAPSRTGSRFHASLMAPVKATAKWAMRTMPGLINTVYQRSSLAKKAMRAAERRIRQAPSAAEFQLYSMSATYPIGRAESALGYVPQFSVDEGVALSAAWLRHSGYLDQDAR